MRKLRHKELLNSLPKVMLLVSGAFKHWLSNYRTQIYPIMQHVRPTKSVSPTGKHMHICVGWFIVIIGWYFMRNILLIAI